MQTKAPTLDTLDPENLLIRAKELERLNNDLSKFIAYLLIGLIVAVFIVGQIHYEHNLRFHPDEIGSDWPD